MKTGFLGLGEMGEPMARNVINAGYDVVAYDPIGERTRAAVFIGATGAATEREVAEACDVVLLSLPSPETLIAALERHVLPAARAGQVVIDLGTTTPLETRRLAAAFAERGAFLLDAPVSGGPAGADAGNLYVFVGGDREAFERSRALLGVLGDPDRITYCGPPGAGQVVKGVNQLAMSLGTAAYLEALAYGARSGLDPALLQRAIVANGGPEIWRRHFDSVAAAVARGKGEQLGVKYRELPYYLREAADRGFDLPLAERLRRVCERGRKVVMDDHREAPSFWHELMRRGAGEEAR